ncbi:MAG: LysM peptidoglycan-binding domain-containing protein [Candidatus Limnocylindria bacterium]
MLATLANRPDTVCPFLGMATARAEFSASPADDHRCYAFGDAAPLSHEQQERVCLQRGYGNCPRYLRGLLVIPTEEMEAIRRRKADFPTDATRLVSEPAPTPAVPMSLAPHPLPAAPPTATAAPAVAGPPASTPPAPVSEPDAPAPVAVPMVAEAAVVPPAMPEPIRIAPPTAAAPPRRGSRRRWRAGTLVMAAAVVAVALLSGTGVVALTLVREERLGVVTETREPTPAATASPRPTAEATPSPTPTPRATPRPTPRPTPRVTATPRVTPVPDATAETWTYFVHDYDSISGIAQHYGTTTEALLDLNPQYRSNPDHIEKGDTVVVPCTAVAVREGHCS